MIILAVLIGLAILWVVCKILKISLKIFWKLFISSIIGAVILLVVNFFGALIGLSITVTFLSALIVGALGIPGLVLVILFQLLF